MKTKVETYELVIIGGGPAGVAAAVYAKATLTNILLVERKEIGGRINESSLVSNYIGIPKITGKKLGLMMKKQLLENDILTKQLEVTSIQKKKNFFVIRGENHHFYSHSIIITTGSSYRELKLREIKNIHYKNFSYKTVNDAHLTKDKAILIIGGGYSGCQAANFLSNFAKKIYLVHSGKELTVDLKLKSKVLKNSKVKVYFNSTPLKTEGEKELESCTILTDNSLQKKLKVKMIFPCIGNTANSKLVRKVVDCTEAGNIKIDNNFQTNIKGLFAAGDVIVKNNSQITTAIAEGSQVAQAVVKYFLDKKT